MITSGGTLAGVEGEARDKSLPGLVAANDERRDERMGGT